MKLIPLTILRGFSSNAGKKGQSDLAVCCCLMLFSFLLSARLSAQDRTTGVGVITSVEVDKSLSRYFDLSIEEEVRLADRASGFDRSVTTAGGEYALLDRKLKVGAYYALMYLYNSDRLFEVRHRYYAQVSYKTAFESFALSWRGRMQGTYRNENRGEYKINPKYVMKNRIQLEYAIWGKPWKPFVSCELSNELNDPTGNEWTRIRYQGGTSWRLNRTDYMDFFIRYDSYPDFRETQMLSIGVGYKVKYL